MESQPIREAREPVYRQKLGGESERQEPSLYQLEKRRLNEKRIDSLRIARETKKLLHERRKEELAQATTATPEGDRNNVQDIKHILDGSATPMDRAGDSSPALALSPSMVFYSLGERLLIGAVEVGASMATAYLLGRAVSYCANAYREWNTNCSTIEQDLSDGDEYYSSEEDEDI